MKSLLLTHVLVFVSLSAGAQAFVDTIKIKQGQHYMYGAYYGGSTTGSKPTLLLLHGFPGGYGDVLDIAESFTSDSLNVITLTFSGVSPSEGIYQDSTPIQDVRVAINYLLSPANLIKYNIDEHKLFLGGWSFGGGVALIIGSEDDRIAGIISIAGFNGAAFLRRCEMDVYYKKLMEVVFIGYRLRGMVNFDPSSLIANLKIHEDKFDSENFANKIARKPLLLFAGTDDQEVGLVEHVMPCYTAVRQHRGKVEFNVYQCGHRFYGFRANISQAILRWIMAIEL